MNEAKALRALADKLDELEALKTFPSDITEPGEVVVTWTEGRDREGYETLSAAISTLVSQHWNALRSQVVKSKEGEVQAARSIWNGISSPGTESATGSVSSSQDLGIRKVG
jgi:hypothetical protein